LLHEGASGPVMLGQSGDGDGAERRAATAHCSLLLRL
jgi:hypothetical protein